MRVALLLALLLALPLVGPAAASATCPGTGTAHRDLGEGRAVHAGHGFCSSPTSGVLQAGATVVTEEGNVTLLLTHARSGERGGAHGVSETVDARVLGTNATTTYASFRDGAGFTRCAVRGSYVLPAGVVNVTQPLPFCVPQEALQP